MRIWSWITNIFTTVSLIMAPVLSVMAAPVNNSAVDVAVLSTVSMSMPMHHLSKREVLLNKYCDTDADCFHGGKCITGNDGTWTACKCQGNIWSGGKCQHISNLWQCRQNKKTKLWTLDINQGDGYRISVDDCSWINREYTKILGSDMLRCVNTADGQQKFMYNSFKTPERAQFAIDNALLLTTYVWDAFQVLQDVESEFPGAMQALTISITDAGRYKIQSLPVDYKLCNYWETALEAATLSIPNKCTVVGGDKLCAVGEECHGSLSEYQCELDEPDIIGN